MAMPRETGKAPSVQSYAPSSVENEDEDEDERQPTKNGIARHTIGIILLLCVVVLWQTQNFLTSSILSSNTYAKPFFLTYWNGATFMLIAVPTLIRETITHSRQGTLRSNLKRIFSRRSLKAVLSWHPPPPPLPERIQHSGLIQPEREAFLKPPVVSYGAVSPPKSPSPSAHDQLRPTGPIPAVISTETTTEYLPFIPTVRLALRFCLLWFVYNYLTGACLQFTTVASSTILGATASIWTLIVGVMTYTEKFSWRKLGGVMTCLAGIVLISTIDFASGSTDEPGNGPRDGAPWMPDWQRHGWNHTWDDKKPLYNVSLLPVTTPTSKLISIATLKPILEKSLPEIMLGDAMSLASAIVYAFYSTVLKQGTLAAGSQALHMPTFFGLVGLFNAIFLFPMFFVLHFTGAETFAFPPSADIWGIVLANSWSSLFGDVMCALAVVFTTPLVVTVGLSLQVPVSLIGQMFIQARYEHPIYWLGALIVVFSFVFVEREEVKEEEEVAEEFARKSLEASLVLGYAADGKNRDEEEGDLETEGKRATVDVDIDVPVGRGKSRVDEVRGLEIHQDTGRWNLQDGDGAVAGPSTPPNTRRFGS